MIVAALREVDDKSKSLWKLIAYVGKYGSTSAPEALKMRVPDLMSLAEATNEILREEAEAAQDAVERAKMRNE